jgi:NAD(P)H-hydrate epimerase
MTAPSGSSPALYTAAECRELDRLAIEEHGLAGFELMQRAGRVAFRELLRRWPEASRIAVCCGRGNNAGDGYVVAGLARDAGFDVALYQLGEAADLAGDAGHARDWALARGVAIEPGPPAALSVDVVVDALLGTGMQGELREPFARNAEVINGCGRPVLAVDIPTGVSADTGAAARHAVRADLTVTFIGRKLGLFTGPGAARSGTVVFDDLGVPSAVYRKVRGCPWLRYPDLPAEYRLARRDAEVHKHALGHVVVVGGDHAMGGAPLMAAEAALRVGAGMVSVVTRSGHRPAILARRPEVMVVDAGDEAGRRGVLDRADVLVVGPGLGRDDWGRSLLVEALDRGLPTVLDADGLNGFAAMELSARGPLVATPHAGEAARLLGWSAAAVQNDRPRAVRALAQRCGDAAVLKGAGSLIAACPRDEPVLLGVCAHGNPGMASAGMGDVLSGVIGALLGQGLSAPAAAVAGTCLHSYAGDRGAERMGRRSLLATDLLAALVDILHDEERGCL